MIRIGRFGRKLIVLTIMLMFVNCLLLIPKNARAQTGLPSIQSLEATVNIKNDGTAEITQNITFISNTQFNWLVRYPTISNLKVMRDGELLDNKLVKVKKSGSFRLIEVDQNTFGQIWQISFKTDKGISLTQTQEIFSWEIFSQPNTTLQYVHIVLHSPESLVNGGKSDVTRYRVFAYHGVAESSAQLTNNYTVDYTGSYIGPDGGLTIMANWPRGTLKFSVLKRLAFNVSTLDITFWIIFGILLPITAVIVFLVMHWRRRKQLHFRRPKEKATSPPSDLSPLLVGILFEKKIYPNVLLSAILDLCRRGYLYIIKEGGRYYFGKRKVPDEYLRNWEKELLEEIFSNEVVWTKEQDVKKRSHSQLFSPKIINVYETAYDNVTQLGYFLENPHWVRIRYKVLGIWLYLLAIIGIIWVVVTTQPPLLLVPLGGVLLVTWVIIRLAPVMPLQSAKGIEVMEQWAAFRNFLESLEPLPGSYSVGGFFYEYLPYAMALNVEGAWVKRFRTYRLVMPDWLHTSDRLEAEEAMKEILAIINHLSQELTQLRGPTII